MVEMVINSPNEATIPNCDDGSRKEPHPTDGLVVEMREGVQWDVELAKIWSALPPSFLTFVFSFDLMTKQTTCENKGWMRRWVRYCLRRWPAVLSCVSVTLSIKYILLKCFAILVSSTSCCCLYYNWLKYSNLLNLLVLSNVASKGHIA